MAAVGSAARRGRVEGGVRFRRPDLRRAASGGGVRLRGRVEGGVRRMRYGGGRGRPRVGKFCFFFVFVLTASVGFEPRPMVVGARGAGEGGARCVALKPDDPKR